MNRELVSVVMATYNGERYLRQQLDSILQQTYRHIELVVVDDGSTDKTLSILNEYAALDDRIHVFPAEKNIGLVANFERGIRLARGEFVALSDQDDIFRKDKMDLLVTALENHPNYDLVISDLSLIDEEGREISPSMWHYQKLVPKPGKPFRRLVYSSFATGCAMMFRRRLLQVALPFPPDCLVHDWWLAVVSASSKGGGLFLVKEPLTAYRQHRANVIGAKAVENKVAKEMMSLIKAPSRGMSIVEARINCRMPHIARLRGYLRKDFWSDSERLAIEKTKEMFEGYLSDAHSGFLSRMAKLPQRVRCAATTGRFSPCIGVVVHTMWPYK